MAATHQFKLPLIDVTKPEEQGLVPGTPKWIHVRDQVMLALQELGSFEAVFGDIVPVGARESVIGVLRDVFELPLGSLDGVDGLRDEMYYGYGNKSEANRFDQNFGIDNIESDEGVERLCKCLWPQGEPPHSKY
ncbi:hypothetical protein MLD38_037214 [Melastoma candidum]|uniref:Uncharacterized protein n=1 Tax=Melastoma candidum TaxID=119954 RepID=A0ACB9LML9_9MYRT|nr:hypothetical protein MLD38_037214 [Melastoma candidum]